jgi:hypothetical protein
MLDRPSPLRDVDELDESERTEHSHVVCDHAQGRAELSSQLLRACDPFLEDGEHPRSQWVRHGDVEAPLEALT